jgi:hypothetical protein
MQRFFCCLKNRRENEQHRLSLIQKKIIAWKMVLKHLPVLLQSSFDTGFCCT